MKHVSQCELDEARDAIRGGASLEQVAGRLRIPEGYLAMLLRSDRRNPEVARAGVTRQIAIASARS